MSQRSGSARQTRGVAASSPDTGLALFDTTTCEPSDPTRPASMSSVAASPVRTCRTQGRALASRVSALVSGSSSPASCATFDPASSSWRTSQRSLLGGWTPFSEAFPRRGMMRSGSICALPTWAPLTEESGCSSSDGTWPTPRTAGMCGGSGARDMMRKAVIAGMSDTEVAAMMGFAQSMWTTPSVGDVTGGRSVPKGTTATGQTPDGRKVQMGLQTVVRESVRPWPTPTTKDAIGGALNPDWVEQLMGFPAGWTRTDGPHDPASPSAPTKRRASRPRKRAAARG